MNSLKFEIETWAKALVAYDSQEFDTALDHFAKIADNSKILTNIGLIYATLGEHELAIENFRAATDLDTYLAIAYYQAGVSNFLLGQFEAAYEDFEGAFDLLRGNQTIDYDQIGLKYQLHACAVLFNQGVTAINYGDVDKGMGLLRAAASCKVTPDHDVIDEAIQESGYGYSVFSVPPGTLYRPNEKKVANMQSKDWMGKAKLISTTSENPSDFAPRLPANNQVPRSAPPLQRRPTVIDAAPAPSLARSRSATTAAVVRRTEPEMQRLERSASASAAQPAEPNRTRLTDPPQLPLAPVQPLALTRQKSIKNAVAEGGGYNSGRPPMPMSPPQRRPTLAERELPPSPPRSETRSPPNASDIYDDYYLQTDDRTEVPLLPRNPGPGKPLQRVDTRGSAGDRGGARLARQDSSASGTRSRLGSFDFEMKRIRVKLFFKDEARGMMIAPDVGFAEFLEMVCAKFSYEYGGLRLKFEDEDGTRVSLRDEGDWEMAVEMARDVSAMSGSGSTVGSSVGKPGEGRLMVWCEEDYR